MRATDKDYRILRSLERIAPTATAEDVAILRRAEMALHRWAEQECGDSNDFASWCVVRDDVTGRPYRETSYHSGGRNVLAPIADREAGALRRIAAVCSRLGLQWYHQGDCRGCSLYVSADPLDDCNYNRGIAVCV